MENSNKISYRTIKGDDNIVVILEDGGIADIRYAEPHEDEPNRQSTTEYYQSRFTQDGIDSEDGVWEEVGEGNMYYNDWNTPFDDEAHIADALEWLAPSCAHVVDESIWPDFK